MNRSPLARLARAGLLTGVADGVFSSVLAVFFYHSTFARLWQNVAYTLLGPASFEGGARTAAIGLLMHFGVAFGWSAVFLLLYERSAAVRRAARPPLGALKVAAAYGPLVWLVMSTAVIPLLVHRPPSITHRWWIQLAGHVFFVGLPIAWSISRGAPADR